MNIQNKTKTAYYFSIVRYPSGLKNIWYKIDNGEVKEISPWEYPGDNRKRAIVFDIVKESCKLECMPEMGLTVFTEIAFEGEK